MKDFKAQPIILPSSKLQPGWMELLLGTVRRACELHAESEKAERDENGKRETVSSMLKATGQEQKCRETLRGRENDREGLRESLWHVFGQSIVQEDRSREVEGGN